jgi:hypothetical protein
MLPTRGNLQAYYRSSRRTLRITSVYSMPPHSVSPAGWARRS